MTECDCHQADRAASGTGFVGHLHRQVSGPGIRFSLVSHSAHASVPDHEHDWALLSFVMSGNYLSKTRTTNFEAGNQGALAFPPGYAHEDRMGHAGARFCCIEVSPRWLEKALEDTSIFDDHRVIENAMAVFGFQTIIAEMLRGDDPVQMEYLTADLVANLARPVGRMSPAAFRRITDMLISDPGGALTLESLAREIGVHPCTLSRQFRTAAGTSIGEYRKRMRLAAACSAIFTDPKSLAAVAARTGFSDQSHMTREFNRYLGMTPSALLGKAIRMQ